MGRRNQEKDSKPEADQGVVLFTALSMILLAFFIMLFNLSVPDEARTHAALGSLIGTFGIMPGLDAMRGQGEPPDPSSGPESFDPPALLERLEIVVLNQPLSGLSTVRRDDGRIALRMDAELLYPSGGFRLSPVAFPTLDELATVIDQCGCTVLIEGHADATPYGGNGSNWYMSAARAGSVQRYLEGTAKLLPGSLQSVGLADTQPAETAAASRRVEIVFDLGDDETGAGGLR